MEKITRQQWLVAVMFHGKFPDYVALFDVEADARIEYAEWSNDPNVSLLYIAQVLEGVAKERP